MGYWIDEALAGRGLVPEAVVVTLRFAFEAISLHRVEISIIPRNHASRRVVEKLGIRDEGIAYALGLLQAGVSVELHQFPGTFHGSALVMRAAVSQRAAREAAVVLRRALGVSDKDA